MRERINSFTEKTYSFGANDRPDPERGEMHILLEEGEPVAADFLCPCGCGSSCYTPVIKADGKRAEHKDKRWGYRPGPTIIPSIRYLGGCKAHFTITNGSVQFHADSGK